MEKKQEYDLEKPFVVEVQEDNEANRPHFYIYNGIMESSLFDASEKLLIIYLIGFSENNLESNIDIVNITKISINNLCKKIRMSKSTLYKYLKSLEQKGILIKEFNMSAENGYTANTYKILNFASIWNCETLEELQNEANRIKKEVLTNE